ncbi:MAG: glycosyltransferase family 2 protein [Candidatus Zixiibacteriota bacterium]
MNEGPKVSIIVPAHNEEENIPLLLEKFSEMFNDSNLSGEVILVDDGSTDKTFLLAQEYQKKYPFLKVLSHRTNRGITDALVTGFKNSSGKIFVFWPADLQYLPSDIPKLIDKIEQGFDVICGWKEGNYGIKRFVSFIYNTLSRWIFGIKVHDLNSVKAFRRKIVEEIPILRKDWHRYMVVMAKEKGFKIDEVRIKLYPRKYGRSKFGFWRIPIGFLDLLSVKFQLSFMKKPMLLFGSSGIILLLLGILAGLIALYLRIFLNQGYRPLLYLVLLCMLLGFSSFALGFLAEAITGLRDEIHWFKEKGDGSKNGMK